MPTEVAKVTDNFPPFVVSLSNPVLSPPKGMNGRAGRSPTLRQAQGERWWRTDKHFHEHQ